MPSPDADTSRAPWQPAGRARGAAADAPVSRAVRLVVEAGLIVGALAVLALAASGHHTG